jgi:riboflavin kinase/FMN adenylyltransferase
MGALGVERVFVRPFDGEFAGWEPERFARDLVAGALGARFVVVGQNFRFGAARAGDLALLQELGKKLGFEVSVHPTASDAHGRFSSTRAREAIAAGNMEEAAAVLGRPHALSGVVVHGDERGRTIDVPTANLDPVPEMLPPDGVYAVRVDEIDEDGEPRPLAGGVTNIGMRPTVDGQRRTVETYILGFSGDIYDWRLRLHVVARLRDEQKFASLDELKAQIAKDCTAARHKLGIFIP